MKKSNLIVSGIVVTLVVSYFIYLGVQEAKVEENVFLNRTNVEIESLASEEDDVKALRYKSRVFSVKDLPLDIQKRIKNQQLTSHIQLITTLKDFMVRFHVKAKDARDPFSVDATDIPPLISIIDKRVGDEKVESIYQKNLHKFYKGHDPQTMKAEIKAQLLAQDAYDYIVNQLGEIFLTTDSALPAGPLIPEEWLFNGDYTPSYGNPKAAHHLIWIGFYGCLECQNFTNDLGLLVQKYGIDNLRVTFIPWTKDDLNAFTYINLTGMCLYQKVGKREFWNFHTIAMNHSPKVAKIKLNDVKAAKDFSNEILRSMELNEKKRQLALNCSKEFHGENPVLIEMTKTKKKIAFIPNIYSPMAIFNGRIMDLEGRSLFNAVDAKMKDIIK